MYIATSRWFRTVSSIAAALLTAAALSTATTARAGEPENVPAQPSPGCSASHPTGTSIESFAAAGKSGTYILDVPAVTAPLPLVVDLHGYLEPAALEYAGTGLGSFGMANGFATVTPQLDEPGVPRWDFGDHSADIAYLSDLLTHVEANRCVDERRVYVTGLSMGAFTTSSLACQLADRIAAVAPVAGLQDFAWCDPVRAVPMVAFHGTEDPIVAYTGGVGPNAKYLPSADGTGSAAQRGDTRPGGVNGPGPVSIPEQAAAWARREGCGVPPRQQQVAPDVVRYTYPCPDRTAVQLYAVVGGGHTWPGTASVISPEPLVGRTTTAISANRIIWDFFRDHPLPAGK
ncbi:alpha/beta hydrolase family esterase [Nocardia violaceofusca]|uniref:alpha/beta hydrolase family esterase n=1 Tax=Nocardia violaceofusca TaxID=941182 RepID=UPI0007A45A9B|nr:PHB depolymerase family esterase [Nocardia violaceofusca]